MAPEVTMERNYDNKCDIWSLGITILEISEGIPHAEVEPYQLIRMIPINPPPKLKKLEWSIELRHFLSICLVKDPKQRAPTEELLLHPIMEKSGGPEVIQNWFFQMLTEDEEMELDAHLYQETSSLLIENQDQVINPLYHPSLHQKRKNTQPKIEENLQSLIDSLNYQTQDTPRRSDSETDESEQNESEQKLSPPLQKIPKITSNHPSNNPYQTIEDQEHSSQNPSQENTSFNQLQEHLEENNQNIEENDSKENLLQKNPTQNENQIKDHQNKLKEEDQMKEENNQEIEENDSKENQLQKNPTQNENQIKEENEMKEETLEIFDSNESQSPQVIRKQGVTPKQSNQKVLRSSNSKKEPIPSCSSKQTIFPISKASPKESPQNKILKLTEKMKEKQQKDERKSLKSFIYQTEEDFLKNNLKSKQTSKTDNRTIKYDSTFQKLTQVISIMVKSQLNEIDEKLKINEEANKLIELEIKQIQKNIL